MVLRPVDYYGWWEPATGCTKISKGCKNCFGEIEANKLKEMGIPRYKNGFNLTIHEAELEKIRLFAKKRVMFSICPISDLFHPKVSDEFILKVFDIIINSPWGHHFKILTKRSERLLEISHQLPSGIPPKVMLGVSVESPEQYYRIDHLRKTKAYGLKGLSLAHLLGPMPNLPLEGIYQVTCTDERGERARPVQQEWILDIIKQVRARRIQYITCVKRPLIPPHNYYRRAMITNLIEPTNGMMVFQAFDPYSIKYRESDYYKLFQKYRHLPFPFAELKEIVRQVAPEFFEP